MGPDGFARKAKLDGLESTLLLQIDAAQRRRPTPTPTTSDPLALGAMIERLGLPADHLSRAMAGLERKLTAFVG
jgi:hypothetical protein